MKNINIKISLCTYCLGTGKLKTMQSMATYNGGSVRGRDIQIKCTHCNGIGVIK